MKIAIMGSGGVGGYFGARLADAGEDVRFIARGAHLAAIQAAGLQVRSDLGDITLKDVVVSADPADFGPVDLVLFCVKLWDTESAGRFIAPLVGSDTALLSLQNGVDAVPALTKLYGSDRVLGGVAAIAAVIETPGVIVHGGTMARLQFGEISGERSERVEELLKACGNAGVDAVIADDIEVGIWNKFVMLSSFSAANCLTRSAIGPIREDPMARTLLTVLIGEAAAVARAKGIAVSSDLEAETLAFIDNVHGDMKASLLHDLERGNRLEVDWLSGAVARIGAENGVETPLHLATSQALHMYAQGRSAQA